MDFYSLLKEKIYATKKQKEEELWDVEGILHNQNFKFDTRPIQKFENNDHGKIGYFKSKADKMVFEFKETWIIVDTQEMHEYIKKNNLTKIYLKDLISKLDWNIILPKK